MEEIKNIIRQYTLQNALFYNGKANPGNVIGKILNERPELKSSIKEISKEVQVIVTEINALNLDEQRAELTKLAPDMLEQKKGEKKSGLKELPNATGSIITRIAPSPSGPLHIGHAYIVSLNYEYVKKYGGKFFVRIEDTNANNIYPPAYEQIVSDAMWLTEGHVDDVVIQSNRMELYYTYALKLIEEGFCYVCTCSQDEFKNYATEKVDCPCRNRGVKEQITRWHKLFTTFQEGDAVVRFKTDMQHNNPAMRDFPLLRINEEEHPKKGKEYRVWPLMNFAVAIDDMDLGVTHALRGKDHADNAKRQAFIHEALKAKTPEAVSVGRINFAEGAPVSCSQTRALIENGTYSGWDDIRIPFLGALKRRGYQPAALRRFAMEIVISKNDKTVTMDEFFKTINAFNKEILDPVAYRYFFIANPKQVLIKGSSKKHIELDLHPNNKKGGRHFTVTEHFYLAQSDYDQFKDHTLYRLMDCCNFKKEGDHFTYDPSGYEGYKKEGAMIMHWIPVDEHAVPVEVVLPDGSIQKGVGEAALTTLDVGALIQFERFGFCRLDEIDGKTYRFWFAHK